jgi:hypothetical protein
VLLYRESFAVQAGSMHTLPVPKTSGGMLPANPSAKNEPSSTERLSTMMSGPLSDHVNPLRGLFGTNGRKL